MQQENIESIQPNAHVVLVSIMCGDHVALASWYRSVFGFEEIEAVASPLFTALSAGPVALGFHHDEAYDLLGIADQRQPTGSRVHCTLVAGDEAAIDASADALRAAGATVLKEPFTTYYHARQVVFADPEGNVMRLSTPQHELTNVVPTISAP